MKAKLISNIIKLLIVAYVFYEYHFQSILQGSPLSADNAKGLLYIAVAGFLILLPIDSSIFIKNFYNAKKHIEENINDDTKHNSKNSHQ